jgi:hypothetical protein
MLCLEKVVRSGRRSDWHLCKARKVKIKQRLQKGSDSPPSPYTICSWTLLGTGRSFLTQQSLCPERWGHGASKIPRAERGKRHGSEGSRRKIGI